MYIVPHAIAYKTVLANMKTTHGGASPPACPLPPISCILQFAWTIIHKRKVPRVREASEWKPVACALAPPCVAFMLASTTAYRQRREA